MRIAKTAYLILALSGLLATSCVRDEIPDCPPLNVKIVVKDKNYFNVDKVELENRVSENLPFREYVPMLYWVLQDLATGNIVDESSLINVSGDETYVTPDIRSSLQHGTYVLTVWGGLDSRDPINDDMSKLKLHPANLEGHDVYMTCDTLLYDAWHNDYTVELERTKGKLIIEKLDLPAEINMSSKTTTGLFAEVSSAFHYDGTTSVTKQTQIAAAPQIVTKTVLSPSVNEDGSVLSLEFFGGSRAENISSLKPKDVNITMHRNELTVLRYVWIQEKQDFDIYMLVNDNWEMITKMEID